ncbi:MAG: hypothetical protein JNK82_14800 [Myxococcaceae bacterium]|nr:hypothetical protein [Myxococcaceae bacterium]
MSCGKPVNVELSAQLTMSTSPSNWCEMTKSTRIDCEFELGIYVLSVDPDGGTGKVQQTPTCVKLEAEAGRKWEDLPRRLNEAMVKLEPIPEGTYRIEVAGLEPPRGKSCDYEDAQLSPSFEGSSIDFQLEGTEPLNRQTVVVNCKKPFTPTAMCMQ